MTQSPPDPPARPRDCKDYVTDTRHLKRLNLNPDRIGGNLMEPHLDLCRRNPALAGISFEVMDAFKIPTDILARKGDRPRSF
jgi:hypothetical protein